MASSPSPEEIQNLLNTGYAHLVANKYYVLASTVMLIYDHILTLDAEIRYIWMQKKAIPAYLFFIFRYSTPIISIINIIGEQAPWWTGSICTNWIWLPVASGVIVSATTGVVLIMRVHAIYARASWVLYIAIPVYLAQIAVMIYAQPAASAAQLPPGFVGCVPAEKSNTGHRLSDMYIAALVFDAMIFTLTLARAIHVRVRHDRLPLREIIVRDGTLYFTLLFAVNLVNVLLLQLAPADLSAINAPFATMITSVLVARLILNLREAGESNLHVSGGGTGSRNHDMRYYTPPKVTGTKAAFYNTLGLEAFNVQLASTTMPMTHGNDGVSSKPASVSRNGWSDTPLHYRV